MKIWTKGIMTGLLAGGLILGSLPAWAESNQTDVGQQEMGQERPTYQGVQSGQVATGESSGLENQQGRIHPSATRMGTDGYLNRVGRSRFNQMGHRSNRSFYQYRHNNFRQAHFRHNNFGHNNYRHNNFGQARFGQNNYRHNNFGQARFGQNNYRHNRFRQGNFGHNNFSRANWRSGRR
jgi:hypothetical protein